MSPAQLNRGGRQAHHWARGGWIYGELGGRDCRCSGAGVVPHPRGVGIHQGGC